MRNHIFLVAVFISIWGANAVFAQQPPPPPPKTVTDFYLALPADVYATDNSGDKIKNKAALAKHRRSLIKIEDVKNGYLRLEGIWEGWAEIALFKKKDGGYLIAQAESGCGPACEGFVKFFTYNQGKWTDVTKQVFPALTETQIARIFKDQKIDTAENGTSSYFLLPRTGTTVKLACNTCESADGNGGENDFILAEFKWNGGRFEMTRRKP